MVNADHVNRLMEAVRIGGEFEMEKFLRIASDIGGYVPETGSRYKPNDLPGASDEIERFEWVSRWLGLKDPEAKVLFDPGNIATPKLDASPIETIKSFWGGELPEFDNRAAVNELFEALMSLWNELARHQSVTKPVQLVRMAVKPDPGNLVRLCQTRTEELEGFIDGLFGDEEVINLPKRANEALSHLADINAMLHGILSLMARELAPSASGEDMMSTFKNVVELSRILEKELHAVVLSGKRARQQAISTIAVDKPTIH